MFEHMINNVINVVLCIINIWINYNNHMLDLTVHNQLLLEVKF